MGDERRKDWSMEREICGEYPALLDQKEGTGRWGGGNRGILTSGG